LVWDFVSCCSISSVSGAKFGNNIQYLLFYIYWNMLYFSLFAPRNGFWTLFRKYRTELDGGFFPLGHDKGSRE
jgi:hypothetical protein